MGRISLEGTGEITKIWLLDCEFGPHFFILYVLSVSADLVNNMNG